VVDTLGADYSVTGYFYNPNIHPQSEYRNREQEMSRYARGVGIDLVCADYDDTRWFEMVSGMEDIPEGGERCFLCYRMRLERVAEYAMEHGYQLLTTTLSISPHKNAEKINEIGSEIAERHGLQWYAADFKKRGGFDRSIRMSKEAGLYRQSYCGCVFSQGETVQRRQKKQC
jgi:predicted adenine nucleotide alpha hydrolase (AANH) superfamily ATPase